MKVLVTGTSGHVGGAVAAYLAASAHEVLGLSRRPSPVEGLAGAARVDIGAPDVADRLLELPRCDAVVHAAASLERDPHSPSISLTNCRGTQALVELAERWEAMVVFISGVTVIGTPRVFPIDEEHPVDPPSAYLASKLFGEHLVELACHRGLTAATLRVSSPVGPGMPDGRILSVFARRAIAGEPLSVAGRGTRRQDYVDVRDVASAVEVCLAKGAVGRFNVAAGASHSNEELARRCVELLGSASPVELGVLPDAEEGIRWEVSIERMRALSWDPRYSLDDAIRAAAAERAPV